MNSIAPKELHLAFQVVGFVMEIRNALMVVMNNQIIVVRKVYEIKTTRSMK